MQITILTQLKKRKLFISLLVLININLFFAAFLFYSHNKINVNASEPKVNSERKTIILTENGFSPQTMTVEYGTTVKFITIGNGNFWPASDSHPSHELYSEFDPKRELKSAESWEFTFTKSGIWKYHDHLSSFYKGTIIVKNDTTSSAKKENITKSIPPEKQSNSLSSLVTVLSRKSNRLIDQGKLNESFELAQKNFVNKKISINECHTLFHLIGHKAYTKFENDISQLVRKDGHICGGAFQHGIEAEIVLQKKDVQNKLFTFCSKIDVITPGISCYHGAGHAFMHTSLDINDSLEQCDILSKGPAPYIGDCYRGVFSEYAFQVAGMDGDTSLPYPGGPRIPYPKGGPLAFCNELDKKYQYDCGSQTSRLLQQDNATDSIHQCITNSRYSDELQASCIQIISALIAQKEFAKSDSIEIPPVVQSFSELKKKGYLQGILGEYRAYNSSGIEKNGKKICEGFFQLNDQNLCKKMLNV